MAAGKKTGGRQKGTPNRKTAEVQARVASSGLTPLDVMLENMRFAYDKAGEVLDAILLGGAPTDEQFDRFKELMRFRGMAQDCAKDAAPYVHPKLAAIEHTGKDGGAIVMTWKAPQE